MNQQEYLAFNQCRQTNFLSRGRNMVCEWLQLKIDLIDKKDLEVFAYLLRVLLARIVEHAIRSRSPSHSLFEIEEPIGVEEYYEAVDQVRASLFAKMRERELDI